jgi:carbohydrate kinase (thermoresistant glucokinase family)
MIYIVMGVSGSGKTTIGKLLAERLGLPFYDADDFHPVENIQKMSAGISLSDEDRFPWLDRLRSNFSTWDRPGAVLACSALKEVYRSFLKAEFNNLCFIYLQGSFELIYRRMQQRNNHFMDASMLQSQFDAFEVPDYGIHVGIDQLPTAIIDSILFDLNDD